TDDVVSFGGSAKGPITFELNDDGTASFKRDKVTASTLVEEFESKVVYLAEETSLIAGAGTTAKLHALKLHLDNASVTLPNDAETNLLTYGAGTADKPLKSLEIQVSGK